MRVVAQWTGAPAPSALYAWQRCDVAGFACETVDGACAATYVPTFDDFAHALMARVDLVNAVGAAAARTPLSDPVLGVPGVPVGTPRATSCGVPAPSGGQTAPQAPATAAAPQAAGPAVVRLALMRPFPVVRIRGNFAPGGVRISLLSVRGPRAARVRAACVGARCPRGLGSAPIAPPVRLRAFERFLPSGTVLRVRVTAASAVGKYASFRIRARRAPRRIDRCLLPGRWAPAPCRVP
jgi:hypothetical protein